MTTNTRNKLYAENVPLSQQVLEHSDTWAGK